MFIFFLYTFFLFFFLLLILHHSIVFMTWLSIPFYFVRHNSFFFPFAEMENCISYIFLFLTWPFYCYFDRLLFLLIWSCFLIANINRPIFACRISKKKKKWTVAVSMSTQQQQHLYNIFYFVWFSFSVWFFSFIFCISHKWKRKLDYECYTKIRMKKKCHTFDMFHSKHYFSLSIQKSYSLKWHTLHL